ncbi:right-handed parallel beta-helix repeat-containing protein [Bacillus sp. CRN 9]|nr:right-handed parallel beta-helix repeat-containing protein [Bacillus sp. CRN 9]
MELINYKGLPVLNVLENGAKGDGVSDDTSSFQEILNMAQNSLGIQVYVPDGVYRMTKELIVFKNTTIIAEKNARIIRDHAGYLMINGYKKNQTISPPSTFTKYNGNGNITISGGVWDGNGVKQTSKASIFHFGHAYKLTIEKAVFLDTANSHHIEFNSSKNIKVSNCEFRGYVGTATLNEAIQLDLSKRNNTILGADDETPCEDVWITDCYFGNSGTSGANRIARAIGSHTATIGVLHRNIHIMNNIIENTLSFAIRAYAWENVTISNNKLNDCNAGINWRTNILNNPPDSHTEDKNGVQTGLSQVVENGYISGNVIKGGMSSGRVIEVYGESSGKAKGVIVSGNVIVLSQSTSINDAILLNHSEDCSVEGNRIYGTKKVGIACRNIWNVNMNGNVIDSVGGHGIEVSGASAYATISNNNIKRIGKNGIYISGVDTSTIIGNTIGGVNGDNSSSHAHLSLTGIKRVSITGNTCRNLGTAYVTPTALSITSGTEIVRAGNNFAGFSTSGVSGLKSGADLQ